MVRFDILGALFACVSSSGLIRIYDFDEFLHFEKSPESNVIKPITYLDTGKDIGDLRWSVDSKNPDDIIVSFLFSSLIHVYDTNSFANPKFTLEV